MSSRRTMLQDSSFGFASADWIRPVEIIPFLVADGLIPAKNSAAAFKPEDGLPACASECMRHHAMHVSEHERRIVAEHGGEVAHFHPALCLPAHELDVL